MTVSRVEFYDKDGGKMDETLAATRRNWALSGCGECQFTLSVKDTKATARLLEFGNIVRITHAKLPDWCGLIEPEREWGDHSVTVKALEYSSIFKRRAIPANYEAYTGTPGGAVTWALNVSNITARTLVERGDIHPAGAELNYKFMLTNWYDQIAKIAQVRGQDWRVRPYITDGGALRFYLDFGKIGEETGFLLQEGHNIELATRPLVETGPIYNSVLAVGSAPKTGDRKTHYSRDYDSIARYGLHAYRINVNSNEESVLEAQAKGTLKKYANPRRVFDLTGADVGNLFYKLNPGNTFLLRLVNIGLTPGGTGLQTTVRLTGMEYDDTTGKAKLALTEVL